MSELYTLQFIIVVIIALCVLIRVRITYLESSLELNLYLSIFIVVQKTGNWSQMFQCSFHVTLFHVLKFSWFYSGLPGDCSDNIFKYVTAVFHYSHFAVSYYRFKL